MTPLVGLVIAGFAAWLAPNVRTMIGSVLALMVAATAVQTWNLGTGRGSQPGNTIHEISYWVVQVIIVSLITAVAYGLFRVRARRAARAQRSLIRPSMTGARGARMLALAVCGEVAVLIPVALLVDSIHHKHGGGTGHIPWTGVLGMAIAVVAIAVLTLIQIRRTRADRQHAAA